MDSKQWNPGKILETSGNYWKACTLHAGIKLDVFTRIGNENLSGGDIAGSLSCDKKGIITLLNALVSMGFLEKKGDIYSNTNTAKSFLSKDSPEYMGHMIMHHHHLVDSWAKLDRAVLTGKPVRTRVSHDNEETRESFLMGMFTMAMGIAPGLAKKIDLSGRTHLLDLGGGPGTYAIHFCLNNPDLKAKIYDLPTTRVFAERTVEKFSLTDRISFVDGDFIEDSKIEGSYDVAWLSHILHQEGPDGCRSIIKKAVSALKPGGMILIHEFILNNTMDRPPFAAIFSLNMLLGTPNGRSYSEEQLIEMLERQGVNDISRLDFAGPTDSGIITGIVRD